MTTQLAHWQMWILDAIADDLDMSEVADDCVSAGATTHEVNEYLVSLGQDEVFA